MVERQDSVCSRNLAWSALLHRARKICTCMQQQMNARVLKSYWYNDGTKKKSNSIGSSNNHDDMC